MNTPQQEARERAMKAVNALNAELASAQSCQRGPVSSIERAGIILRETGLEELIKERDQLRAEVEALRKLAASAIYDGNNSPEFSALEEALPKHIHKAIDAARKDRP